MHHNEYAASWHAGDALDLLPGLEPKSVALFFTSPPCADQRAYSRIHPDRYVDWFLPFGDAFEYVYHFARGPKPHFDLDAIRVPYKADAAEIARRKLDTMGRRTTEAGFGRDRTKTYLQGGADPGNVVSAPLAGKIVSKRIQEAATRGRRHLPSGRSRPTRMTDRHRKT